jgi:hypothetical protein
VSHVRPSSRLTAAALTFFALVAAATAAPGVSSVRAILDDPDRFDGQPVTLRGTITNLRERVSRRGNAYYTFDLLDGDRSLRVFSFGTPPCRSGAATVEGTFFKVKRQGRSTFYNEVDASTVTCR